MPPPGHAAAAHNLVDEQPACEALPVNSAPRMDAVVAHVLSWHNRHPLARRIKVAEVGSIGLVSLPFAAPSGNSEQPVAAFTEDFLAPSKPDAVGRWAARHGHLGVAATPGVPLRLVVADGPSATVMVLVATAAIEAGSHQRRLLVGRGDPAAVLGRRIWSRSRLGAAGVLALAVGVGLAWVPLWLSPHPEAAVPLQALAVTAASSAASGAGAGPVRVAYAAASSVSPVATPTPTPTMAPLSQGASATAASQPAAPQVVAMHKPASEPAPEPAPETAHAPSPAALSEPAPEPAHPARPHAKLEGGPTRPVVRPQLDDDAKAEAREAVAAARLALGRPASAAPVAHSAPSPAEVGHIAIAATKDVQAPAKHAPGVLDSGPAFALSSRLLRTRAEAEQVTAAVQALLLTIRPKEAAPLQVEIVPVGDDWRVAAFPFPRQAEAQQARALLASRGMRVAVVDF